VDKKLRIVGIIAALAVSVLILSGTKLTRIWK